MSGHKQIDWFDTEVVIPITKSSTRLKNKNTTLLFYKTYTLLQIKLAQTLKIFPKDKIIVYTDSESAVEISDLFGVRHQFVNEFSDNTWSENIDIILKQINAEYFMFNCVTTPHFGPSELTKFINHFVSEKENYKSAATVVKIQSQLLDSHAQPINFGLGTAHVSSQDTQPIYNQIFGATIIESELAKKYHYFYDNKPLLHCVDVLHGIDINNEIDFKCAQEMIANVKFKNELCLKEVPIAK